MERICLLTIFCRWHDCLTFTNKSLSTTWRAMPVVHLYMLITREPRETRHQCWVNVGPTLKKYRVNVSCLLRGWNCESLKLTEMWVTHRISIAINHLQPIAQHQIYKRFIDDMLVMRMTNIILWKFQRSHLDSEKNVDFLLNLYCKYMTRVAIYM